MRSLIGPVQCQKDAALSGLSFTPAFGLERENAGFLFSDFGLQKECDVLETPQPTITWF